MMYTKFDQKCRDERFKSATLFLVLMILLTICMVWLCSGCNVTRTVTTKAEYYQKGDTTIQIVTRTTESYDGSVKPENLLKY